MQIDVCEREKKEMEEKMLDFILFLFFSFVNVAIVDLEFFLFFGR